MDIRSNFRKLGKVVQVRQRRYLVDQCIPPSMAGTPRWWHFHVSMMMRKGSNIGMANMGSILSRNLDAGRD